MDVESRVCVNESINKILSQWFNKYSTGGKQSQKKKRKKKILIIVIKS